MTEPEPERGYSPLDDPERGEFSNRGRTGWDWQCTLWVALMIVCSYGLVALIALALRELWG